MAFDTDSFEKLGAFYLGRPYDLASKTGADTPLLYKSRDLVTHAVCVGMTGSGKTGLCLALLEEAAIDGIPAIIIDPKGDLGNLMLTFPDLKTEDFLPWINPEDAARKNQTPEEFAAGQADLWREGLASWGEGPDRIRHLKEKAEVAIYTPGSTAGIPVNVLASFDAPKTRDPEELSDRAQTSAASLLGLLKIAADPIQSRVGIFLCTLFTNAWQAGENLSLESIIEQIQHPPFSKVGVLDLETFYPSKDRFALVMALNNILASPAFATWREGAPLDIAKTLYTPEGKPRLAIFSIAHLGDDERMFFVSLLLNQVLSWTRAQSGTTSLRAILYMDEIFGYLPPSANPPSKRPMLTMLKQARAFGVGVVLATQNPVDLDYKALSNAGTWFIGRLQTERDKARVLDGLQGASSSGKFDRQKTEALLASLGNRIFLMNNVNDDAPTVFETRWVMSYLRGPLTRDQIRKLMEGRHQSLPDAQAQETPMLAESGGSRPPLPPAIPQVFVPSSSPSPQYRPVLIGAADLTYNDTKSGFETTESVLLAAELPSAMTSVDWGSSEVLEIPLSTLTHEPAAGATYETLPALASQAKSYSAWEKEFRTWLASSRTLEVLTCKDPKAVSEPQETEGEFRARLALQIRESRDAAVEALHKKFAPREAALQVRLERAHAALKRQKQQASAATMQTMISVGSSLLSAFLGKKAISATNLGRATTAARGVSRSMKEGSEAATAGQSLENVQAQVAELETDFAAEAAALTAREPEFLKLPLKPQRGGISGLRLSLGWLPQ